MCPDGESQEPLSRLIPHTVALFFFKDVEKKVRVKSPKLHTPGKVGTCPPPSKNAGISILETTTSPNHVAEAGARVSSP